MILWYRLRKVNIGVIIFVVRSSYLLLGYVIDGKISGPLPSDEALADPGD